MSKDTNKNNEKYISRMMIIPSKAIDTYISHLEKMPIDNYFL